MARRAAPAVLAAGAAVAGAVALFAATGAPPKPSSPSILLVTIDTWRADAIGRSGSGRVATPALDRLAGEGVFLRRVQAPGPLTTPSHATILTGLSPRRHGLRYNLGFRLAPGVEPLAASLQRAGWRTEAVVSATPLRKVFGLDRGFDHYDDGGLEGTSATPGLEGEIPGSETTRRALAALAGARGDRRPLFLWVHYYGPHAPYAPPEPFRSRYANDPYAGEVAAVDAEVGKLLAALPPEGRRWTVVVTGDHGEGLGDHGEATHGMTLYREVVEVPLVLHPKPGRFVDPGEAASLADVAPTLCAVVGVRCAPADGASWLAPLPRRALGAETALPLRGFGLLPTLSVREGGLVLIRQGVDEFYDLSSDPAQRRDVSVAEDRRDDRGRLARRLAELVGPDPVAELLGGTASEEKGDTRALRSLGYLAGRPSPDRLERVDLRTFLPDLALLEAGRGRLGERRFAEAEAFLGDFTARHPGSALAFEALGQARAEQGKSEPALAAFARALDLDPSNAVAATNIGNLRAKQGDLAGAVDAWRRAVGIDDTLAQVHLNLGALLLGREGGRPEAERHLRRFLELSPNHPAAAQVRRQLGAAH